MATHTFGPWKEGDRLIVCAPQGSKWNGQRGHILLIHTDPVSGNLTFYVRLGPNGITPALPFGEGEVARS